MKKCSKSAHHTLTELNITPLLDLAFVLLVIFILTTTPLANDIELKLPRASEHKKDPPRSATYITVKDTGEVYLDKLAIPDMNTLHEQLLVMRNKDTNTSVIVRGDAKTKYSQIRAVLDICQRANVLKLDLATEAADKKM
jgi:biopolymer transport protein ExbD